MDTQHNYATTMRIGLYPWLRWGLVGVGVLLVLGLLSIGAINQGHDPARSPVAGRPRSAAVERYAAFKEQQAEHTVAAGTHLSFPPPIPSARERYAAFKEQQADQYQEGSSRTLSAALP